MSSHNQQLASLMMMLNKTPSESPMPRVVTPFLRSSLMKIQTISSLLAVRQQMNSMAEELLMSWLTQELFLAKLLMMLTILMSLSVLNRAIPMNRCTSNLKMFKLANTSSTSSGTGVKRTQRTMLCLEHMALQTPTFE